MRDAPGEVDQIWQIGAIRRDSLPQFCKCFSSPSYTQEKIAALPVSVCVIRRPVHCLIQSRERSLRVAELFPRVAKLNPEIVVAIA